MTEAKQTKSQRVRELLNANVKPKETAALAGVSLQYVYDINSVLNREKGIPKRRGRPPKPKAAPVVAEKTINKAEQDLINKVSDLRMENLRLKAIIGYLEGKLAQHGSSV